MAFSLRGIHVPHRKNTANTASVRMPAPQSVALLTLMHIGKPAVPVVKVGDHVDVGTLVAEQSGFISSPVYASVSGSVKKITEEIVSTGARIPAIHIESDGAMTPDASLTPPVVNSKEDFIDALKKSGIVGLGGAGFPTYVKFATDKPVDTLVIKIGRRRWMDASRMAVILSIPISCFWLANSTIKIPFFATKPISMMIPIWL